MSVTYLVDSTGSYKLTTASDLANDEDSFRLWAAAVDLTLCSTLLPLPNEMQTLLGETLILPTWLAANIDLLRASMPAHTKLQDNNANQYLHVAMPDIIKSSIDIQEFSLDRHKLEYCEADFRRPINNLIELAWAPSREEKTDWMFVLLDRMLSLPDTRNTNTNLPFLCATTTPDSVSCIRLKRTILLLLPIYSSFPKPISTPLLPHCIAEYQAPGIAGDISIRQVQLGMVSALYQRRAMGLLKHFVFGISHESGFLVRMFAARWEPGTNNGDDPQSVPSSRQAGELLNARNAPQLEGSCAQDPGTHIRICVYALDVFDLSNPYEALRFYLLLRATMTLAERYKNDIEANGLPNATNKSWAAPLPKHSSQSPNCSTRTTESTSDEQMGEVALEQTSPSQSRNALSLESNLYDISSSDELLTAELGRDNEVPMDLGSNIRLTREALEGLAGDKLIDKCRRYLGTN
ncbi:hypothetical protein BDV93DRAFT_559375 [Ceratobasidium sp. AG-I]|nr:hypothetical protein BDV93DRAFT_559375 [Ceratobasidium sp. AG-I]